MKITVFGATGGTGVEVVRQALDAGHGVTAVVRDTSRLPAELRTRAEIVEANVMDPDAVEETVKGRDAVISTIGTRDLRSPTSVCTDSTRSIIAALRATSGSGRLVIASNSAMAPGRGDDPFTRYLVKPVILARLLRHMINDMRQAEQLVRASDLAWTIVRAGRLTDRPGKGTYRSMVDRNVLGGFQITRTNFATAILDASSDPASAGHVVSVAN
ncbi:NAD(P)-dependent oxidoreductase [Actinomadura sp. 6N118]|uniref:NAD(P)-dependent oxidoreductase n=1 Tax=Actinomadura sp. 6N118 TaxID=3375151 RepID=UPI0037A7F121